MHLQHNLAQADTPRSPLHPPPSTSGSHRAPRLIQNRVQRHPVRIAQLRHSRRVQRRQHADHLLRSALSAFSIKPTRALRRDRGIQHQRNVVDLLPLPRVLVGGLIRDQLRLALHQRLDNSQPVRPQRRPGLRHFHNRVRQRRRLHLGRAPAELHRHRNILSQRSIAS